MALQNGATLEMVQNIANGKTVAAQAEHAQEAEKLTQNAGASDRPVYFSDGVPRACGNEISASITGNAATATSATRASMDGNGNNIVSTYATKTALNAKANTSGTYPNLTVGSAQNVRSLYAHYIHGADNRGGSGQFVYWNAVIVNSSAAPLTSLTMPVLQALGYAEGDEFPLGGIVDRGGFGANGVIIGLKIIDASSLALEIYDENKEITLYPVITGLSVSSSGESGKDMVVQLQ